MRKPHLLLRSHSRDVSFEIRRAERHISDDDILYGLRRSWKLASKPNFPHSRCGNWEYLIETCDADEQVLHLKIAVDDDAQRITIITKY